MTDSFQWRIQDFLLGGSANLRCGYFLAKMYVKTKELDPVGGVHAGSAPRSANAFSQRTLQITLI